MFIESDCSGCGKRLRVKEEHRGKKARCPQCNSVYVVGANSSKKQSSSVGASPLSSPAPQTAPTTAPAGSQWLMKTPEGQTYGPVSKPELDNWLREGRLSAQCQLREATSSNWQPASAIYPQLGASGAASGSTYPTSTSNPYQSPQYGGGQQRNRRLAAHRGPLVLILAILAWVPPFTSCGFIFSIVALILANTDLAEMDAGRMDPEGRSMTSAGRIVAIVNLCLVGLSIVGICCIFMLTAIADA